MFPLKAIAYLAALILFIHAIPAMAGKKRVGVLLSGDIPYYNAIHRSFVETLSKNGYAEDRVALMVQKPAPGYVSWLNAARRYAVLEVDLVVTYGEAATWAVLRENDRIPVAYAGVPDFGAGKIPGKNATGIRTGLPIASLLKYMKKIVNFRTLGVVYSSVEPDAVKQVAMVAELEGKFGFRSIPIDVKDGCNPIGLPDVDTLLMTTSTSAALCADRILLTGRDKRIPTVALLCGYESEGVVFTVGADPEHQGELIAGLVIDILNGRKASAITPRIAGKNQMIINLAEARRLDLKIPVELLMSATKIIKE